MGVVGGMGLERLVFGAVEAGAVLAHVGQVAVAHDAGLWVAGLQSAEQVEQCLLLGLGAGVGGLVAGVEPSLVAHADGVLVVAQGVGSDEVLVARLVDAAVAGDVVVVAGEAEAVGVASDEGFYGEGTVAARGAAMDEDEVYFSHGFYGVNGG